MYKGRLMKSSAFERALNEVYHKGHVFVMMKKAAFFSGPKELVFPIIVRANFNVCSEYMYIS